MTLILSVISSGNNTEHESLEYEFNESGGTIGRRLSNAWVLPDDNRHLSGSHATIEFEKNCYFIIDTSTNGVFVNGSTKPLGRGNRHPLEDGFQLMMGTFTIRVAVKADKELATSVSVDEKVDIEDSNELFADLVDDPVDALEPLFIEETPSMKEHYESSSTIGTSDPFFKDDDFLSSNDDLKDFGDGFKEQTAESNTPELDSFFKPSDIRPAPEDTSPVEIPELTGSFKEESRPPPKRAKQVGKASNVAEGSVMPVASTGASSVIPDDWDVGVSDDDSFDDLFEGLGDPFKEEGDPFALTEINNFSEAKVSQEGGEGLPESVVPPPRKSPVILGEDVSDAPEMPKRDGYRTLGEVEEKEQIVTSYEFGGTSEVSSGSVSSFLKGLGVDEASFQESFSDKELFLAGKLLRIALQGSMEVLQSRANIKNEMRMDMTTIRPIQNNPIKFAVNVDEALNKMFLQKDRAYMDPERAMNEAFDDIKSHQIAVISGIQASLVSVLKRFEPDNLVERLEKESPISANIPIHRKAKLWDKFEALYDTIESEAEDDFNRLFGQEFAKAYDEQVALLEKQRGE